MRQAQNGDTVAIRFTATTEDGQQIASSPEGEHVDIEIGSGRLLPAIEEQLIGMSAGETKDFDVTKENGFPRADELVIEVPRDRFPAEIELEVGRTVGLQDPSGQELAAEIVSMDEENVTLDANPPFTGQGLKMKLELAKIHAA